MTNEIVIQLKAQLEIAIAFAKGVRPTLVEQRDKDWTDRLIAGWQAALNTPEPRELHAKGCPCPTCLDGITRSNIEQGASRDASSKKSLPSQPPIDNEHVAEGCEKFNEQ